MNDEEMMNCSEKGRQVERLREIMTRLRAPGGCPWDAEQTHESLVSNLIEETYETVDTIQRGDLEHLKEELGDLLLQVVFHSELEREAGNWDMDEVARGISEKLVRRHPHVFATSEAGDSEAVLKQWDEIKRVEKGDEEKPFLHGIGKGLPALLRAAKLQKKAAKVGFDWPDAEGILEKVEEELEETREELEKHTAGEPARKELEAEVGDLLFVVVNLARKLGIDPEVALEGTNVKFTDRFGSVESGLKEAGQSLEQADLGEMERRWQLAKERGRMG
ncbi:MAG: nucleoside triphosphate pyrophosphohydrolase [Akkermansiaceae bacterium]|nr:nucleoside triphosphate pyrophosphohydrolase [Akkermansiaceae bacterium]